MSNKQRYYIPEFVIFKLRYIVWVLLVVALRIKIVLVHVAPISVHVVAAPNFSCNKSGRHAQKSMLLRFYATPICPYETQYVAAFDLP